MIHEESLRRKPLCLKLWGKKIKRSGFLKGGLDKLRTLLRHSLDLVHEFGNTHLNNRLRNVYMALLWTVAFLEHVPEISLKSESKPNTRTQLASEDYAFRDCQARLHRLVHSRVPSS